MLPADFLAKLRTILPPEQVFIDPVDCYAYAYDNSRRISPPEAVAFPTGAEQVREILRLCHDYGVAVTAAAGHRHGRRQRSRSGRPCALPRANGAHPFGRSGQSGDGGGTGRAQPASAAGGAAPWPVLASRSVQRRLLQRWRESRHLCRRTPRREIRHRPRPRAGPQGGHRNRGFDQDRLLHYQGRRGLRPHPAPRRVRRHPGNHR